MRGSQVSDTGPRLYRADPAATSRNSAAGHPRLQTQRHHQPPRRFRLCHRQRHRGYDPPQPCRRVPPVPQPHQPRSIPRPRSTRRVGQRLHPQNPGHTTLATTPSPLHVPPHPHLCILDEPCRAMVLRTHHQTHTPRHTPISTRTHRLHQPMDQTLRTKTPDRSSGAKPPTKSSTASPTIYSVFPTQDTSS